MTDCPANLREVVELPPLSVRLLAFNTSADQNDTAIRIVNPA